MLVPFERSENFQLIAEKAVPSSLLVDKEANAARDFELASKIQLEGIETSSNDSSSKQDEEEESTIENDAILALQLQVDNINSTISKTAIVDLFMKEREVLADSIRARQLGTLYEANEKKERMDHEFAEALQKRFNEGRVRVAGDDDVESVLGKERVEELLHSQAKDAVEETDIDFKGKGKGKAPEENETTVSEITRPPSPPIPDLPICQICFDPCRPVFNPAAESSQAGSSDQLYLGMYLGDPIDKHLACIDCLTAFIGKKLEDQSSRAFPMSCPQCDYELTDEDAARIFGSEKLEGWHYRKLLDSQPPLFCPNRACSARSLRDLDAEDEAQASCPSCHKMLCVFCGVVWHSGFTCEQFQSLPVGERDPEDFALFDLAKEKKWSRCPSCKIMMEHISGCNHMICSCGTESCYNCGALWTRSRRGDYGRCSRVPSCALWHEHRLIAADPRDAARLVAPPPRPAVLPQQHLAIRANIAGPQAEDNIDRSELLNFLLEPYVGSAWHWTKFTYEFRENFVCGYCQTPCGSSIALRDHLVQARHAVYFCCRRFFRQVQHLDQHVESTWGRHNPVRWEV
ncbi:hypothetical protein JCM3765_005732 [Sporobolomyces pararoseus]